MEKIIETLLIGLVSIIIVGAAALFGGTIVHLIWPVAVPAVFPGLVASGTIAAKLTWVQSVCLTWLFGILIKSSQTINNSK